MERCIFKCEIQSAATLPQSSRVKTGERDAERLLPETWAAKTIIRIGSSS